MKKNIGNRILAALLVCSMILGMAGIEWIPQSVEAAGVTADKTLETELEGYRRITATDIVNSNGYKSVDSDTSTTDCNTDFQLAHGAAVYYPGDFGGKTYLDIDVNYNYASAENCRFDYMRARDGSQFYYVKATDTALQFHYYNKSATSPDVTKITVALSDYGISRDEFFNIKILTDIRTEVEGTEQVTLQLWLNEKYAGEFTQEETAHDRFYTLFGYNLSTGAKITIREPKNLEKELEGYTQVTISDYNVSVDSATRAATIAKAGSYTNTTDISFNKAYFDVDVNFNVTEAETASGLQDYKRYFQYQGNAKYSNCFCFSPMVTDGVNYIKLWKYNESQNTSSIKQFKASDFNISSLNEYINIKFITDIEVDTSNSEQEIVTYQLWLNDRFACEGTLTQAKHDRTGFHVINSTSTSVLLREPSMNVNKEIEGYRQITMADYGFTIDPTTNVTQLQESSGNAKGMNFDNSYLDVDVNFNVTEAETESGLKDYTRYFQYQGNAKYSNCFCFSPMVTDGVNYIKLWKYNESQNTSSIKQFKASDFNISSLNEYINIKFITDIEVDTSNSEQEIVTYQLWLNDRFACEGTLTQAKHDRTGLWSLGGAISVKSPLDVKEAMRGYKRVTFGEFAGFEALAEEGTEKEFASAIAGKYQGDSLHRTYLDVKVKTSTTIFMNYLMSPHATTNNSFYGDGNYFSFVIDNSNLLLRKVVSAQISETKTISLSTYGVTDVTDYFNLKVKTDIQTNASDATQSDIILQVWINDYYVGRYVYTETTRVTTYAGIRGGATAAATTVQTPIECKELDDVSYDLSQGTYLLSGADSFYVNGVKKAEGDVLSEPGDYYIERMLGNEIASIQRVSLYYLGDVNLDGSAFVTGDPVYKDSYALSSVVKYGSSIKAVLQAADLDNDEEVTATDLALINAIKTDVTKKDEYLAGYFPEALTYDYLGGDTVMPIGGYYGPMNAKTITDDVYKLIAESGVNLIVSSLIDYNADPDLVKQSLALAEKHGVGLYIKDSGLNTITKDDDGTVTEHSYLSTASDISQRIGEYSPYRSFLGAFIVDEPKRANDSNYTTNYRSFAYYKGIAEAVLPYSNLTGYVNLHGSQAITTTNYADYLKEVEPYVNVLSFDTYLYFEKDEETQKGRLNNYLYSLDTIRNVAKEEGKPFWSFVQAGTDYRDDSSTGETVGYYTEEDTLWIVNTSLAYGAKGIEYFPLLQPTYFALYDKDGDGTIESGEYDYNRNGLIGANLQKNNNYAMVQKANEQIAAVDEVLMKSNHTGVIVTGTAASAVETAETKLNYSSSGILEKTNDTYTDKLKDVATKDIGAMIGCFDYRDSEAFYVVNYDRTEDASQQITLEFNANQQYRIIQEGKTTYGEGTTCVLNVPAGAGVLVVLEDYVVEYTAAEFASYRTGETFVAPEAPVGYVFAGWFLNKECVTPVSRNATTVTTESVYAKFVDENLLNIKAQILADTTIDSDSTDIKFVFAVDTLDYYKVGFRIKQGSKVRERSSTKVYATLSTYFEGTQETFTPKNIFCETATRFKTWTLSDVPNSAFDLPFEVSAFWITLDGTQVYGPEAKKMIESVLH